MAGGEGAGARHLDVAAGELIGLLPCRAPTGAQRLGEEVGEGGGDAQGGEAGASRPAAARATEERQRGRRREPELALVGGEGEAAHGDVKCGRLAGGDRLVDGASSAFASLSHSAIGR